uniref:Uncharacterized protein n=1 Tax=Spongospora subterranea TaxID=70186 RepID=A0A0H5QPC0_9EUKA|eukprot:CRZ03216.1 hypothetical protein [Spongospora subterranea]
MVGARQGGLCAAIDGQHASSNTKMHAIYAYFFLGLTVAKIATIFRKGNGSISRWINRYQETGEVYRRSSQRSNPKFSPQQRKWIFEFILKHPLSFLDETRHAFILEWGVNISVPSVWRIMSENKLTYKVR